MLGIVDQQVFLAFQVRSTLFDALTKLMLTFTLLGSAGMKHWSVFVDVL